MGKVLHVQLVNKRYVPQERLIGHEFDLAIRVENPGECQLRWYEKTEIPYLEADRRLENGHAEYTPGMRENCWNNMCIIGLGRTRIFDPWYDAQELRGEMTVFVHDDPAMLKPEIGTKKERHLYFRLIVEGSDGTERSVEALQDLCIETDGRISRKYFTVFRDDVPTTASGFYGHKPPTYRGLPEE